MNLIIFRRTLLEIQRITSFSVDHDRLTPGIYISRVDGDVTTYDLRTRTPNAGSYMDTCTAHSVEHMFATYIRNSAASDKILYFGPMGCQTGFYLIVRDSIEPRVVLGILKDCLKKVMEHDGSVFGASAKECGNYINLDLNKAKKVCGPYMSILENIDDVMTYEDIK